MTPCRGGARVSGSAIHVMLELSSIGKGLRGYRLAQEEFSVLMGEKLHIPTKQKRRSTGQSTKRPLDHQRPEKMEPGWHLRPRAFAPQASVMATGVREDVSHEYTGFMRRGEDARLHERF